MGYLSPEWDVELVFEPYPGLVSGWLGAVIRSSPLHLSTLLLPSTFSQFTCSTTEPHHDFVPTLADKHRFR